MLYLSIQAVIFCNLAVSVFVYLAQCLDRQRGFSRDKTAVLIQCKVFDDISVCKGFVNGYESAIDGKSCRFAS